MEMPLVSVIIPNYNHAKYLDERIQSVLNQTYKNFEVVILDDNSKDNSRDIIEKYRSNAYVSQIVYNEVNSGSTFKQWHKGMEIAKGSLVWIAESDDTCELNMLERLVSEFLRYPNNVISFSTSTIIDPCGNIVSKPKSRKTKHLVGKSFILHFMVHGNTINNASSCVFKKAVAQQIPKQYASYRGAGDRLFWIEIAMRGEVSIVNEGLNYFRQHNANTTSKLYLDGTNFIEDKLIFDYLIVNNLAPYSKRCLAKWYVNKRISATTFGDDVVKNKVVKIWNIKVYELVFGYITKEIDKVLAKCCSLMSRFIVIPVIYELVVLQ